MIHTEPSISSSQGSIAGQVVIPQSKRHKVVVKPGFQNRRNNSEYLKKSYPAGFQNKSSIHQRTGDSIFSEQSSLYRGSFHEWAKGIPSEPLTDAVSLDLTDPFADVAGPYLSEMMKSTSIVHTKNSKDNNGEVSHIITAPATLNVRQKGKNQTSSSGSMSLSAKNSGTVGEDSIPPSIKLHVYNAPTELPRIPATLSKGRIVNNLDPVEATEYGNWLAHQRSDVGDRLWFTRGNAEGHNYSAHNFKGEIAKPKVVSPSKALAAADMAARIAMNDEVLLSPLLGSSETASMGAAAAGGDAATIPPAVTTGSSPTSTAPGGKAGVPSVIGAFVIGGMSRNKHYPSLSPPTGPSRSAVTTVFTSTGAGPASSSSTVSNIISSSNDATNNAVAAGVEEGTGGEVNGTLGATSTATAASPAVITAIPSSMITVEHITKTLAGHHVGASSLSTLTAVPAPMPPVLVLEISTVNNMLRSATLLSTTSSSSSSTAPPVTTATATATVEEVNPHVNDAAAAVTREAATGTGTNGKTVRCIPSGLAFSDLLHLITDEIISSIESALNLASAAQNREATEVAQSRQNPAAIAADREAKRKKLLRLYNKVELQVQVYMPSDAAWRVINNEVEWTRAKLNGRGSSNSTNNSNNHLGNTSSLRHYQGLVLPDEKNVLQIMYSLSSQSEYFLFTEINRAFQEIRSKEKVRQTPHMNLKSLTDSLEHQVRTRNTYVYPRSTVAGSVAQASSLAAVAAAGGTTVPAGRRAAHQQHRFSGGGGGGGGGLRLADSSNENSPRSRPMSRGDGGAGGGAGGGGKTNDSYYNDGIAGGAGGMFSDSRPLSPVAQPRQPYFIDGKSALNANNARKSQPPHDLIMTDTFSTSTSAAGSVAGSDTVAGGWTGLGAHTREQYGYGVGERAAVGHGLVLGAAASAGVMVAGAGVGGVGAAGSIGSGGSGSGRGASGFNAGGGGGQSVFYPQRSASLDNLYAQLETSLPRQHNFANNLEKRLFKTRW